MNAEIRVKSVNATAVGGGNNDVSNKGKVEEKPKRKEI